MDFPDDLKLRSSMTLFASVADDPAPWQEVIDSFFGGHKDQATLDILAEEPDT